MNFRSAVFFDRDGVLSQTFVRDSKPYAPRQLEDFKLEPEAEAATSALKQSGFLLVVVTNQPDVGNGFVDRAVVDAMNQKLMQALPIDQVETCFHAQSAGCECRKPSPGMLLKAAQDLEIDLATSFLVGDRYSDVEAGQRAGCCTVLIDRNYREPATAEPEFTAPSLKAAADWILSRHDSATDRHLSHSQRT